MNRRLFGSLALLFLVSVLATKAHAEETASKAEAEAAATTTSPELLTIGSPAAPLDITHWVSDAGGKFGPVTELEDGKVYVIEFWATWCGPCISSMPHLAEIQAKYIDQDVQIISVSDEDIETVETFLERKYRPRKSTDSVESEDDESVPTNYGELTAAYCLTVDPDESVHEDYFRAAGQSGIPSAFIVGKTGMIEWIGHPMRMDAPLDSVVNDLWDRDAFAEEFEKEQRRDQMISELAKMLGSSPKEETKKAIAKAREEFADDASTMTILGQMEDYLVMIPLQKKVRDGENVEALEIIEELYPSVNADQKKRLAQMKLTLQLKEALFESAAETLATIVDEGEFEPRTLNLLAWSVYEASEETDNLPKELVTAAISAVEQSLEDDSDNPFVLDTLAHLQYVAGDLDAAIATATKAVANSKDGKESFAEFLEKLKAEK